MLTILTIVNLIKLVIRTTDDQRLVQLLGLWGSRPGKLLPSPKEVIGNPWLLMFSLMQSFNEAVSDSTWVQSPNNRI